MSKDLMPISKTTLGDADGLVLYALPASEFETETLVKKATEASVADRKEVLIAIPQSIGILQDAVAELARLRWVEGSYTPELASDATARRELSARIAEAERTLSNQLSSVFGANYRRAGRRRMYVVPCRDSKAPISSRRELNAVSFRQSANACTTTRQLSATNSSINANCLTLPHERDEC